MDFRQLLLLLAAPAAHASLWWHGETGWWGPSPEGRRYQLTEERANFDLDYQARTRGGSRAFDARPPKALLAEAGPRFGGL